MKTYTKEQTERARTLMFFVQFLICCNYKDANVLRTDLKTAAEQQIRSKSVQNRTLNKLRHKRITNVT
jgi:hypothetical protein